MATEVVDLTMDADVEDTPMEATTVPHSAPAAAELTAKAAELEQLIPRMSGDTQDATHSVLCENQSAAFARLAANNQEFLQLKAQAAMLEALLGRKPVTDSDGSVTLFPVAPGCEELGVATTEELASTATACREGQAAGQARCQEHANAIAEHSAAIAADMAEVKALAEQYTSIVQDLDAAREDIARHNEGPCGSVTEDACQSTLAQQVGQIQDLTMAVATLEETQHTLDTEVAASKSKLSELAPRAQAIEEATKRVQQDHSGHAEQLERMSQWYRTAASCLGAVGGVEVSRVAPLLASDGRPTQGLDMVVHLRPCSELHAATCDEGAACLGQRALPAMHVLELQVQPLFGTTLEGSRDRVKVAKAQLSCPDKPSSAATFIGDIVAAANATEGARLSWLVHEIHSRVHCEAARLAHMTLLRNEFAATSSASSDRVAARDTEVTFTLPCQVVASVRVTADYPKPSSSITITELTSIGWTSEARRAVDFRATKNELNATHMSSLPKLARHLSAKFGPVYEQSKLAAAAGAAPRGLARFADVLAK